MRRRAPVTTAVIVPARDEARRIAACLRALAASRTEGTAVALVANNCVDETVPIARAAAEAEGLELEILQCRLGAEAGVGTARRLGFAHALKAWPGVSEILNTDADCIVEHDWVARNRFHLTRYAAVCGRVEPMAAELTVMRDFEVAPAEMEGRYDALVTEFYRLFRPGPCGLEGDHGGAAGASLAVRADACRAVGGFADLAAGEDRDLVRRLKSAGFGVLHAGDPRVFASCRLEGRAEGGMAGALRTRAERTDYLIDEALPPARVLIDAAERDALGPWPLRVADRDRIRARDLSPHIAALEEALRTLKPARWPVAEAARVVDRHRNETLPSRQMAR